MFLPNGAPQKELIKIKEVYPEKTAETTADLATTYMHWFRSNSPPPTFLHKKSTRTGTMGSLLGYGGKIFFSCHNMGEDPNYLLLLPEYGRKSKPPPAVASIWEKIQTIFFCYQNMGETQTIFCYCKDMDRNPKIFRQY
jgi:hypothetical protein